MQDSNQSNSLQENDNQPGKYSLGVAFGLITGLIYIVLLLIRYNFFAYSPVAYNSFALGAYIIILFLFFITGYKRKKQLGQYAETKEIFLTIFIAILITEGIYVLFNYIYLAYIDPDFLLKYLQTTQAFLAGKGMDASGIEEKMTQLKNQSNSINNIGFSLIGWALWVIIDGIIGLIFSLALRKPKPQY